MSRPGGGRVSRVLRIGHIWQRVRKSLLPTMGVEGASLVAQLLKNPPTVWETWVQSLGDPLEEGMATHCSILAWRIPWTEEPGRL